ncbi:MAG: AbrB family transcriptional regulator [Firmicutes bacterium]|nr:AbrB family transcriptional regulator [Bacillota bacterium]
MLWNLLLTLGAAALGGLLFKKLNIPAGLLVGAIFGAAVIHLGFDASYMPKTVKTIAQIVAGGFIGTMVSREDVLKLKSLWKVAILVLGAYCSMNIIVGYCAYQISDFDLLTMLMCTIPGGLSDVPLIAADMGADLLPVIMVHFVRAVAGIGIFPIIISHICRNDETEEEKLKAKEEVKKSPANKAADLQTTVITLILSTSFGLVGMWIGIPAGTLVGAALGVSMVKVGVNYNAIMPKTLKKIAQVMSGAYIGCAISMEALLGIGEVIVPLVFIMACYMAVMYVMGNLLHRKFSMARKEAMLMMTPAGASDMALIASDLGINSPSLIVIQVVRLFVADAIMPQVCYTAAQMLG